MRQCTIGFSYVRFRCGSQLCLDLPPLHLGTMDWLWGQSAASSTTVVDYTPAYVTAVVIAAAVTAFFGSKLYQHLKPKDRPFVSSPAVRTFIDPFLDILAPR